MVVIASDIAAGALKIVGSFATYDIDPDPAELNTALGCLADLLEERVGTKALWYFVPTSEVITLVADQESYVLNTVTDENLQFVMQAELIYNGEPTPLELIRRSRFDQVKGDPEVSVTPQTGTPCYLYIEKKDNPKMYVWPVPTVSGYTVKLLGQKYSPDITQSRGQVDIQFPKAWKRYWKHLLAIDIGSGPIIDLPPGKMDRLERRTKEMEMRLEDFHNKENVRRPRFTRMRDF